MKDQRRALCAGYAAAGLRGVMDSSPDPVPFISMHPAFMAFPQR
jgi:hypothetical protein